MKDLEDEADRLLEKLQPIKKLQDNLRRNISQIKELINQARKQANSVSWQKYDTASQQKTPDLLKPSFAIVLFCKNTNLIESYGAKFRFMWILFSFVFLYASDTARAVAWGQNIHEDSNIKLLNFGGQRS